MQATQSKEKMRRLISEKLKLGMKALLSKADSLRGATKRLQEPSLILKDSLTLKESGYFF